ncbi:MAG: CCA tRNA nucleotidyltransferase [Reyranellaceae bacterium]
MSHAQLPWIDDPEVDRLLRALAAAGIAARFVGGCVRNWLSGRVIDDIDIAVDKPPQIVTAALEAAGLKVVPTGIAHGTVTAVVEGRPFELTTLRRDVETDGRRAVVAFTDDWRTDAERRDFTFNALYVEPDGTLHDYFGGQADLQAGRVRFIGDPEQRIAEDRLRVLRFFRFHAWFGRPPLDGAGFQACRRNAASLRGLSAERVRKELLRLLEAPAPADALDAMVEAGALDHWLPEFSGTAALRALVGREPAPEPIRRLAAVLGPGADARVVGKRLKLSTQETVRLQVLLEPPAEEARHPRAALYRLGPTLFVDRVLLLGETAGDWRASLDLARRWPPPELPVRGADVLKLGLKPGPAVQRLLDSVEAWWIDGDFRADRTECLAELERRSRDGTA